MKIIVCAFIYIIGFNAEVFATSLVESEQNQEKLVLQDLEQIQNHGKKWHYKLKKATTVIKPITGQRQAQNEG